MIHPGTTENISIILIANCENYILSFFFFFFLEGRSDSIVLLYKRSWNKNRTKQITCVRKRKGVFYHQFCKGLWEKQI